MDLFAIVCPLKTTSGFRKTENSVDERRLTSNARDPNGRETRYVLQQIAKKRR